jgi:hypothetical protein
MAAELDGVVAAPAKLWRHGQSGVFVGYLSNLSGPGKDSPRSSARRTSSAAACCSADSSARLFFAATSFSAAVITALTVQGTIRRPVREFRNAR